MRSPRFLLWLCSTVAFVLATIVATTAHELGHLAASKALGLPTELFANAVENGSPTDSQAIVAASAGPVLSLVLGLVIMAVSGRWGTGFVRLFWMWLGLMSTQIFFGYLMIAIIARVGDTGKVLDLLGAPAFVYWLCLAVGIVGMLMLSRRFAVHVVAYAQGDETTMRAFGIFSWLAGTAVIVGVYLLAVRDLPADVQLICVLGAVATGIFAPMFSFFYKGVHPEHEALALTVPVVGIVVTLVAIVVVTTVLATGVTI